MTAPGIQSALHPLAHHEGAVLYAAPQAMLKGLLETEVPARLVAGPPDDPFGPLFRVVADEKTGDLLRQHDLAVRAMPTAARAVTVAHHAARGGQAAVALVPNEQLPVAAAALARAADDTLARGAALALVLEDRPGLPRCPIRLARQLGLATIVPIDVAELRVVMDTALRVSRAGGVPVAVVVHTMLLRSAATVEVAPNRVIEGVDAMLARRRRGRRPRLADTADVLRVMRRLEFNRMTALPSPGERTHVGFVTIGPAAASLAHLTHTLRLGGRVATLRLGAVHPLDESAVARLLERCEEVVVLEPRPGTLEAGVLRVAESMRHRGERPAAVWGGRLPAPEGAEDEPGLGPDDAVHPSLLARRVVHLLHLVRPTGRVASQLVPDPIEAAIDVPPRAGRVGADAALDTVRRLAGEVDAWLREHESSEEEPIVRGRLVIDGVKPPDATDRLVMVETWTSDRFQREGIAGVAQAARDERPWIFLVCDVGGDERQDLRRLARGVVPADRADRVVIEEANLADATRLGELVREAALVERLTIIVIADGPPPRYDVDAIDRALGEVDRLGFEPRQRLAWPLESACSVRPPVAAELDDEPLGVDSAAPRASFRVDVLPRRIRGRVRVSARPMRETVRVVRTRPPARRWSRDRSERLPLPEPVHAQAARWRAHLAGFRGVAPGAAALVLVEAGCRMGYAVASVHDPTPIAPGRRAWVQVLFTHPRPGETSPPLSVRLPFGEADLLLGLDGHETLRAIEADATLRVAWAPRTFAVVNDGAFAEGIGADPAPRDELVLHLRDAIRHVSRPQGRQVDDFTGACRAWFHTDRVADVAMLGAAFQAGLVPVTVDAIQAALLHVEGLGYGRLREAFGFGRRLALDHRLFSRPRDDEKDPSRVVRRLVHVADRRRVGGGGRHTARFVRRLDESLAEMPGLSETDAGREARRDFVAALYRCDRWGGDDYREQYARLVTDLYHADRGETGRALTRAAILPLAEAMLVRDAAFVASMATSPEHRRRTRRALNVKRAREDHIDRRFLSRLEVVVFGRRVRADVVTSDWPARLLAPARMVVPARWRGARRERELRDAVIALVTNARGAAAIDYERYAAALRALHERAVEGRLRELTPEDVAQLVTDRATSDSGKPGADATAEG